MTLALSPPAPIVVSPPVGLSSALPIVTLSRTTVEQQRKRVRLRRNSKKRDAADCSFGNFDGRLRFDAWPFFHAAVKTSLTRSFRASDVDHRALCFWGMHQHLFVWNTKNLRRVDRDEFDTEEFDASGLAGRFGEAVAHLMMVSNGYVYWDRIGTLWARAARKQRIHHRERLRIARAIASKLRIGSPPLQPDFAMEKTTREVALMESKGSFVHPERDAPNVKDDLRHALNQLGAWSGLVTPTPQKCVAIGTYFRDESDDGGDPSLIAVVDPPGEGSSNLPAVEFPEDWIRRGNYGGWLIGMGFGAAGDALRNAAPHRLAELALPVVEIAGRNFAVAPQRLVFKDRGHRPWLFYDELFFWPNHLWEQIHPIDLLRASGASGIEILGLDTAVLRTISTALADPSASALLQLDKGVSLEQSDYPPPQSPVLEGFFAPDGFSGSIMPDGSLLGILNRTDLGRIHTEMFSL